MPILPSALPVLPFITYNFHSPISPSSVSTTSARGVPVMYVTNPVFAKNALSGQFCPSAVPKLSMIKKFTVQFHHQECRRGACEVLPIICVYISHPYFKEHFPKLPILTIATFRALTVQFQHRACQRVPCDVSPVDSVYIAHTQFRQKLHQTTYFDHRHFPRCLWSRKFPQSIQYRARLHDPRRYPL